MEEVTLTCPFTGMEFDCQIAHGIMIYTNPLTGKRQTFPIDERRIAKFDHVPLVTPIEAANMIGCTRQYLTKLMREGKLKCYTIGGMKRLKRADVESLMKGD